MNRDQARQLISETLQTPYDKARFSYLVKNLLNHVEDAPFTYRGNLIRDSYDPYIQSLERLGKYQDPEGNKVDVLVVHLKRGSSLERARTMQRNFVGWYLNGSRGGELKDAALTAFVSPDGDDWRFSLVKMEYRLSQTPTGKVRAKEEFTPARRYSFLVGAHESCYTAQSRLIPFLENDDRKPTLQELEDAFNIEKVTKEFFTKYRELYCRVKEELDNAVSRDVKVKADFASKNVSTIDFAKKLLGQIVFLYFLQKKGWFGVKRGQEWGLGSKQFLRELFAKKHGSFKNYFNDVLEPLFYEALRLERPGDYYSQFDCRIPFLNGGLFDPINDYDWWDVDLLLPNELFSNKTKTQEGDIGDGILDVFDRYNFTVKEDEPLEKEVAVDPEMLGKVFENLLEVKDRKSKGTYYTPREIVHYMCQESLINYLFTACNEGVTSYQKLGTPQTQAFGNETLKDGVTQDLLLEDSSGAIIPREDIETLIKHGEIAVEHDTRVEETGKETKTYSYMMPESVRNNAKLIDQKLASIFVCDPAVGSGAFPVGMMHEIVRARNALTTYMGKTADRTPYDFKRHAIQSCLYGVDIDPGAVEIAKLRLWLSLIVDEEDIKQIKPLPNLDYKVVCGNSLTHVEVTLENYQIFEQLEKLKPHYFDETNAKKKLALKHQIDELIGKLTNGRKDFDFEVYFSEVYHSNKGFDVVIANPPYVSYGLRGGQKMAESEKDFLRKNFPHSAEYKISLYAIFMDRGLQIAKPDGGIETYIVPDSFLLGRYFSKIREFILRVSEIDYILLLPFGVFDATVGFSVVYLFQRKRAINPEHAITAKFAKAVVDIGSNHTQQLSYPQSYFNSLNHKRFRLFFDVKIMALISKIEKDSSELGRFLTGRTGVRSLIGQKQIISSSKKGAKWQPGLISGSQVLKYKVIDEGHHINIDPKLLNKGGWDYDVIHNPKLLVRQTGDTLTAAIDYNGFYHLNNIHSFAPNAHNNGRLDILYLLALFNSQLLAFYYKNISLETGRAMAQTDIETLEALPVKEITKKEQGRFIALVEKILTHSRDADYTANNAKQDQVKNLGRQIDQLVFELYGLTKEEVAIVEGNVR